MKLSQVLKDWPEIIDNHTNSQSMCPACAWNRALTSCDREIEREALAKVIFSYNFPTEKWEEVHENTNKHYLLLADHIISTMPTWLKRSENK